MKRFFYLLLSLALCGANVSVQAQPTGFSASAQHNLFWPMWKRGKRGEKVRILQRLLNVNGAQLKVDGQFGFATEQAVRRFQTARKITADGIVGAQTWEKLIVPLKRGSRGPMVGVFQSLLVQNGYRLKQDGIFGQATENVIRKYQRKEGADIMADDGRAEFWVWCWLLGGSNTAD